MTVRVAMWSGPRNISTAMMRSFGARPDAWVTDEPLYAHYLKATGAPHPGREEVIALHESDWRVVARQLAGPVPGGKAVFYQKHMAHHLLPAIERDWLWGLEHAFLIRDPREMLSSLAKVTPEPGLLDTGLPQQVELVRALEARTGKTPPVLDARDLLAEPEALLRALCRALELEFQPAMLAWKSGLRSTDGVWAKHWYGAVSRSTGFERASERPGELPAALEPLHAQCAPLYRVLHERRLTA